MSEFLITTDGVVLKLVPRAPCVGCYFYLNASGIATCRMKYGNYTAEDIKKCARGRGFVWEKVR